MRNAMLITSRLCRAFCVFVLAFLGSQISANELKINIVLEGAGAKAENGMQISVHYEGRLRDGTVFDGSNHVAHPLALFWA